MSKELCGLFPDVPRQAQETTSSYLSSHEVAELPWLQQSFPKLASLLLSAHFKLTFKCEVAGYKVSFPVLSDSVNLIVPEATADDSALSTTSVGADGQQALNDFTALFKTLPVPFNSVVQHATTLSVHVPVKFTLDLFLDKTALNKRIEAASSKLNARIVSFLFQQQLITALENTTVDAFETEFLTPRKATIFLVFDLDGTLASQALTVCGREPENEVDDMLAKLLAPEVLLRVPKIHEFREGISVGNFAPRWLTPDTLAVERTYGDEENIRALKVAFQRLQPVLAAIFLADRVEADADGIYSVEYRGLRPRHLRLDPAAMAAFADCAKLYNLYSYAYDGLSADKLEIVQQFLSQFVEDIAALCKKATDVLEAARKTYDRTLITKVQEYFTARQNVQEGIQTAVSQLTGDVVSLSRDVSADLYKVMGIIALAIAGWFFKADTGITALFLGFLAIAIYLFIVVIYHLPTLKTAAGLRKDQTDAYINSFSDVLTADEIQSFLNDPNWKKARDEFSDKCWWTVVIYVAVCVICFVVAIGIGISLWGTQPYLPPLKPGV